VSIGFPIGADIHGKTTTPTAASATTRGWGHDVKGDVRAVASRGATCCANNCRKIDRVCEPDWHTLGTTGVRLSTPIKSLYHAELHKYWWARTVSNRRPLVCKTRALPLSYAPVRRQDTARSAPAPKRPGRFRRSAPSAHRSTAAGHGPRRAASSRRTGSSRTGRPRTCRGWRRRRRR
jgi:hypothetical protein